MSQTTDDLPCFFHGVEPIPDTYYILCLECGHCYQTREDVETLDYAIQLAMTRYYSDFQPTNHPASTIYICPLCTHDF